MKSLLSFGENQKGKLVMHLEKDSLKSVVKKSQLSLHLDAPLLKSTFLVSDLSKVKHKFWVKEEEKVFRLS